SGSEVPVQPAPAAPTPEENGELAYLSGIRSRVGNESPERGKLNDLITVFTLAPWLEDGIGRIGRKRMESVVEIYASTSGLSDPIKEAILQVIGMDTSADGAKNKAPVKECLRVLAELDNLLWRYHFDPTGAAVMSLFLNGKDPPKLDEPLRKNTGNGRATTQG
ncbi:MAG: hypothetical protein V3S37_05135, partial [Dehalococcoidia bacterium]